MANEGEIVFGNDGSSAEADEYRKKIEEARKKGGVHSLKTPDPVGKAPRPTNVPLAGSGQDARMASAISETGGVQPRPPGSPLLSQETARGLQAMAESQVQEQKAAEEKEAEEKKEKEAEGLFEMFDFAGRNEAERVLNNKKRRQDIEARCAPMSIEDLILRDEVQQLVPIIPGKFEVLYRSMTPEENLFIKRYVSKDQGQSDQYVLEKFGLCQLVCTVVAINGRPMPEFRKADGEVDEKAFEVKLKMLLKKSGYVAADLGLNYAWFDVRVRKLLNPDALGNS